MPEEKNEIEILFPEIEVEGVKVRPWSLGQLIDLAPIFESIAIDLKKRNVKVEHLGTDEKINELILSFLPYVAKIISVTIKEDEKVVREWSLKKATAIILTIMTQNLEQIKNSFGLGKSVLQTMQKETG